MTDKTTDTTKNRRTFDPAFKFFGTLKSECFYLREFRSVSALRKAVEDYIHYYNNERISLKLKGLSPVEYRTQALRAA